MMNDQRTQLMLSERARAVHCEVWHAGKVWSVD
jgi:hypothetical protein